MVAPSLIRARRTALFVPGDRQSALRKAETLGSDVVIFDLEDAVAPAAKHDAREAVRAHFAAAPASPVERVIRINGLDTPWGTEDLLAARAAMPDAVLIPKVDSPDTLLAVVDALEQTDVPGTLRLWAMIETPGGIVNAATIAARGRDATVPLACLVAGTNDLYKATGLAGPNARTHAHPWLMQIVLAARAAGIAVLDGVYNDHRDAEGCAAECQEGAQMGFDGKTLIHPGQIGAANAAFAPGPEAVARARRLVAAFAEPQNEGRGVIAFEGAMAERLHLEQAEALLARAARIADPDRQGKEPANADESLSHAHGN
ncbi:MAG: CoA ester lyase [Roseitalea porphyridii]|jgi:citrate lyase subunit beta/citryl-CoA lyase|uniref:HpcH/HpaI aldolase/citrate lyase family protein n=1 Tax=Roseitalea porphyridii TaxID=1852022 RepID=UPI0032EB5791